MGFVKHVRGGLLESYNKVEGLFSLLKNFNKSARGILFMHEMKFVLEKIINA